MLLHQDCMKGMHKIPDKSVDLVLTDPPYNISRENNFKTIGRNGIDFGEWDKDFDLFSWLNEIPRILKTNGSVIIFNDWKNLGAIASYCEELGLEIKDMIRWEKVNPMPRNMDRRYITDYECAIWLTNKKGKWTYNRLNKDTYQRPVFKYSVVSGKERKHPTQKPLGLIEDILKIHSNEHDVVLDPFAGSGTTGVACLRNNREFIGYEIDKDYYEVAVERLKNEEKH